jgi:hypothetical protein
MSDAPRFVVRRLNWRPAGDRFVRLPGETRLASFESIEAADSDRARREAEVRARLNPFRCGTTWPALTTVPQPVYLDWLQDAGVLPPVAWSARTVEGVVPLDEWAEWWQRIGHVLSAEQVAHVWNGLNRVRFFEVIERPISAVAFAVVQVMWEYNDAWYEPGSEGGRTVRAFRSRERAEAERQRLEAERRQRWDDRHQIETRRWELSAWPALGDPTGVEHEEALEQCGVQLYEVVEIDLGENAS